MYESTTFTAGGMVVPWGCSQIEGRHQFLVGSNTCVCGSCKMVENHPFQMPVTFHPSMAAPVGTASA